ncbi:hypothetical protein PL75_08800 [Neisseria arctica]|uniref:Uncharacterized protein n=1 Tax=Neisseria arctica TaxID=1470200 RepID=A0A0J0YQE0_9NEIS|nr:hypothetical protein [Neisseria arctica]KLT72350.1 hypothetical protein PL75_08800 [Neisseria arctica]UOO85945.1 hypothetical protein LVJ86_06825 [Neisseria arctica]
MIWEFIATLSAALGAAGLVMLLKLVFKRLPKWSVPAAAGLGMLAFQVHSEYTWFAHTRALLPGTAQVVAEVPETAFYKPWSYIRPQVLKFIALDSAKTEIIDKQIPVIQTNLYFFERRMSAHTLPVWVNCRTRMLTLNLPENKSGDIEWGKTPYSEKTANAVCPA